jgi:ornithine cyclodeaminase
LTKEHYEGELGAVVDGKLPGRTTDQQITLFKTVGTAATDVYVAEQILQAADQAGRGKEVQF